MSHLTNADIFTASFMCTVSLTLSYQLRRQWCYIHHKFCYFYHDHVALITLPLYLMYMQHTGNL